MGEITNLALNSMPWWVSVLLILASGAGTHVATRLTSKDRVKSQLVSQVVARQGQLDERQNQMMDDFCRDIDRLRDELVVVREELNAERRHSVELSREMESIKTENRKLSVENTRLQEQVTELKSVLQKVQSNERARSIREEGGNTCQPLNG